jgi:uncharacterized protein (DUF488 family)
MSSDPDARSDEREGLRVHTVGHGTLAAAAFASLLDAAGVRRVVDVRAYPGSRHNPQFGRDEMEQWVPDAGIDYAWMRALGGRRKPRTDSKHVALRNDAFRAYADYMETDAFRDAVDELVALAGTEPATVMCSESVWWRCHRRLIADHLVLVRGVDVVHLMHDGRATPHVPTEGVRLAGNSLVYDVGTTLSLSPVVAEPARVDAISDLGGDSACWAHLVCPECGALSDEGHRPGCASAETR